MTNIIYALVDPETYKIRYIGKSSTGLSRPRRHLTPSKNRDTKIHKERWVNGLLKKGLKPLIWIIEIVSKVEELNDVERLWIKRFKDFGFDLTNTTEGGDGWPAGKPMVGNRAKGVSCSGLNIAGPLNWRSKPVTSVDLITKEIQEFENIKCAGREGFSPSHISQCCREISGRRSHKGRLWFHKGPNQKLSFTIRPYKKGRGATPIISTSVSDGKESCYLTLQSLRGRGFNLSKISMVCKGQLSNPYKGNVWRYK